MPKYNLLIIKNRYTKKHNFSKSHDWFKKNANLEVVETEITTDFDVTTQDVSNATFKGVIVGADILQKLRTVVPENKYNAVVFIYGNELKGISLSACNVNGPLYQNTEFIQLAKVDWRTLNHEMFHGFFSKANRLGASLTDNMDSYYRDSVMDINNGATSRTIALTSLAPFWDRICSLVPVKDEGCKQGYLYSSTTGLKCPTMPPQASTSLAVASDLSKWKLLPTLEKKAQQFLIDAKKAGYNLKITQGWRDPAYQDKLYAQGRTLPGKIVTNATGKTSNHCLGKAFDIAFVGSVPYPDKANWKAIGAIGKALGLKWGGDWTSFKDLLHFEI